MEHALFTLEDPRPIQADAPYTYQLPHPKRIDAVGIGDLVKLIFCPTSKAAKWRAERMWVEVTEINGGRFSGTLANKPFELTGLMPGTKVSFQPWHITDVVFNDEEKDRQLTFPCPTYFDRCIADICVLSENALVQYIYREEPDIGEDGDAYPDSGWRIRGDWRGLSDEEVADREAQYTAIGRVLNQDDSWLHLIDSPVGSAFIRDWENDAFVEAET